MKKKKLGAFALSALFAFLLLCAAVATCIFNYNRYTRLCVEIKEIVEIPRAKAEPSGEWHNPNSEMQFVPDEKIKDENYLHYYVYDNIEFVSYSQNWDKEKLVQLKDELLLNEHGPEIDYLDQIIIYGQEDMDALGYHDDAMRFYPIIIFLPGLLPQIEYNFSGLSSIIELTGGDTFTEVSQMARTLSHEYGHHFTNYYFFNDYNNLSDSKYYELRNDPEYEIYYEWSDVDHYYENHSWYLWELAADDYVYFFGSPETRYTEDYLDDFELLKMDVKGVKRMDDYYNDMSFDSFNLAPHLNTELKLPDKIPGLQELFENCLSMQTPRNPYDASDIEIKIDRKYKGGYAHYEITWNKPWTDENILYTLVAYKDFGELYQGVKTIDGSENANALFGQVAYSDYYLIVDLPDKLTFRVIVTFPEGFAAISPPVEREF